ncbi:hypothetical protein FJT64_023238 [Amphibalanus amphitrite]|uniref:Uncharacterized protein n=1 Tax=Amphibalanus amphitrite TaxID=1232801 RepID=A0A6A4WGA6_AMPAM|nr:hypothetical protein FJT64_023238 [Amphibalanus amphitrite]
MVSAGRRRPWLALIPLALLLHAGSAARLSAAAQDDEGFDILAAIKDEVDTMNTNLDELSAAIDTVTHSSAHHPTTDHHNHRGADRGTDNQGTDNYGATDNQDTDNHGATHDHRGTDYHRATDNNYGGTDYHN